SGLYLVYAVSGHVRITITNQGGPNAILNGLFLDPNPTAPQPGDAGFEAPAAGVGRFQYTPKGTPWSFAGGAGIAANRSGLSPAGTPAAPEGAQVGFLQGTGAFSQAIAGWAAGTYRITFRAAQRANFQASREDFQVLVDGAVVGTFTPAGAGYAAYATASFTV